LGVHSFAAFIPSGNGATCITAGPDGNLWFTETSANQIGRVTPTGTITEFSLGTTPYAGLTSIAAGPDGNVWFTEPALNRIAQITPTGVITEFSAGISAGSGLGALTAGPDGNIWFTEPGVNKIGRITTPTPVIPTIDSPSIIPAPINGISTQTPQSTGGCTPGDRKLVLITHGWQPTELGSPNITMLQSMATNIRGQIDQHYSSDSCNWDVSMLDWTPRAWTTFPQEAFANADEVATQAYAKIQARQALVGQYKTVHLIAHSAGSEVVDSLAQKLKKDMPSVIVQETLLDAYNPGGNINNYGCSADWAESYVDMRPNVPAATLLLQPLDIGDENLTLTGALNFDVTQLGDATWPQVSLATIDDIANFGAYHEWPVDWYSSTIAPTSRPYGWPLSIEAGQNSLHTLPSYVSGANRGDRVCLASSGGTYQCPPVTTGPPPFLSVHCGSQFVAIGQSIWDFVASTVVSLTGTVYVNEASFELITGSPASPKANESRAEATDTTTLSPAWLKLNINVPKAASTLQFDAVFSSAQGAAGFLTVFVDGQQVHAREEANITPGATTSISVPTGSLAAGVHWVGFRLDPTNSVESQVQISNVRLGNTTLTSPSIVWRNSNGDVFLWFMSGGTISSSVDLGVIPSSWAIQGTGDFNGDGNSDILWRNSNGDVVTWFMNGPTIASSTDLGVIPASWTVQGTGDFNGDGTTDILWRNSYGDVVVWFMNAGSIASSADLGVIPGDWTIQGTGDFDGDGKTDILWRNATGDVVIWFMNGGTIASSSDLGVIPSDWSIQRTGDFDGDGKSDILWRNVNGDVVVWFMNAGTIASSTDLGVIPSSWTIQGTGDFNGDGKADILWRNANGDVVTWLMNGGAIGSSTDLGVIPTSWAINGVAH